MFSCVFNSKETQKPKKLFSVPWYLQTSSETSDLAFKIFSIDYSTNSIIDHQNRASVAQCIQSFFKIRANSIEYLKKSQSTADVVLSEILKIFSFLGRRNPSPMLLVVRYS